MQALLTAQPLKPPAARMHAVSRQRPPKPHLLAVAFVGRQVAAKAPADGGSAPRAAHVRYHHAPLRQLLRLLVHLHCRPRAQRIDEECLLVAAACVPPVLLGEDVPPLKQRRPAPLPGLQQAAARAGAHVECGGGGGAGRRPGQVLLSTVVEAQAEVGARQVAGAQHLQLTPVPAVGRRQGRLLGEGQRCRWSIRAAARSKQGPTRPRPHLMQPCTAPARSLPICVTRMPSWRAQRPHRSSCARTVWPASPARLMPSSVCVCVWGGWRGPAMRERELGRRETRGRRRLAATTC